MMKTKLKHLILLLFAFAIWSCNDDYEEHNHEHNFKNYKIKKYTYKQALKLQKFGAADKIAKQSLNLKFGKINLSKKGRKSQISKDASSILAIDSSLIKEVSTGDITSYTMLVVLDSVDYSDGSFDNLVIQTNKNNETDAFVIHYKPSSDIEYNAEHKSYNFEGTTTTSKVYGIYSFFNNGNNNTPGSNEGFYGGEPGGSTGSIICVDVLKCNGTRHGGVGPIHNAGPGCTQTFTVRECSSNPNWNPYSTGSGGSNESGGFGNGNNNTGPGGGGMGTGGNTTGSNTTNPNNPITSTVFTEELEEINSDTPCHTLKSIITNNLLNVKSRIINDLRPNINQNPDGEKAVFLKKEASGRMGSIVSLPTTTNQVEIRAGINFFAAIHTHPLTNYPMFSWSDIFVLKTLHDNLQPHNAGLASFLLVCKDNNGVDQTYAIVFDESANNTINNIFNSSEYEGCNPLEIVAEMDVRIKKKFKEEDRLGSRNYERAFLRMMLGYNVSLYKANSDLTDWNKLSLNNLTGTTVNSTPCN